jgi:hypothetical protein
MHAQTNEQTKKQVDLLATAHDINITVQSARLR